MNKVPPHPLDMTPGEHLAYRRDISSTMALLGQQYLSAMLNDWQLSSLRERHPEHPAIELYDRLEAHRTSPTATSIDGAFVSTLPFQLLGDYARDLSAPALSWPAVDGTFWNALGATGKRFAESRLPDPDLYDDVLAEVRVWTRWRNNGVGVRFVEDDGMPDLHIPDRQLWCEIKAVSEGASSNTISGAVSKANRQLKRPPEGGGIAVFWLSRDVHGTRGSDGDPPADVERRIDVLERRLQPEMHRSITTAYAVWDEFELRGAASGRGATVFVTRRTRRLHHPAPRRPLPDLTSDEFQLEATFAAGLGG